MRHNRFQKNLKAGIRGHSKRYIALGSVFALGIAGGTFAIKGLSASQFTELNNYINGFLQLAQNESFNNTELFAISLKENVKFIFLLWLSGITVIGIPFIYLLVSARGFVIGFSSGLFIKCLGVKGSLFAIASIFPSEFITVPCFIILAANGLFFSFNIIRSRSFKDTLHRNIKTELVRYSLLTVLLGFIVAAGCFIDSYVSPVFVRTILPALPGFSG